MSAIVCLAAVAILAVQPTAPPRATHSSTTRILVVSELPNPFLDQPFIDSLGSGLSTTLVASAVASGGAPEVVGEGRARIRYDLWDEVYRVDSLGFGDDGSHHFADRAALETWWRGRRLDVGPVAKPPQEVRLRLVVLPFSASEGNDARLWFSRSVRRAGTGSGSGTEELNSLLERVMATAIRRQQLLSFDVTIDVNTAPPGAEPP